MPITIAGTNARHTYVIYIVVILDGVHICGNPTWLKFTETQRKDVLPIAIFNENIMLKRAIDLLLELSICLGFTVLMKEILISHY